MNVRVRFAPSPTGPLHIGGVRTALFNYMFAKKNKGRFILRIEDTDQKRYVEGAEDYIIKSLNWLGIDFDESVQKGGNFAPYRQSERSEIYKKHIKKLIEQKKAYYAFDTPQEIEEMRKKLQEQKSSVQHYNHLTRKKMKNSFTLSAAEVQKRIENNEPYVIRFNMPTDRNIVLNDIVRGKVKVNTSELDDKVLFKSDGLPTYHLANIVDDHLMEISHVIRGEEWLPSLGLHNLLYEAFGWKAPEFAHLPLILKPNGKGKLSKRDGQKHGFPVFPLNWEDPQTGEELPGYKQWGYLPEAVVNMLALLGWNPATDKEIYSLKELTDLFDLKKVQKGGAKFNPQKAEWFNQQHLKNLSNRKLSEYLIDKLNRENIDFEQDYVIKVVNLVKERAVFAKDLWDLSSFFFIAPKEYNKKAIKKRWKSKTPDLIKNAINYLQTIEDFTSKNLEKEFIEWIKSQEIGLGKVLNPLRLLLVGNTTGPHLFDIMSMIGKEETIKRLKTGLEELSKN